MEAKTTPNEEQLLRVTLYASNRLGKGARVTVSDVLRRPSKFTSLQTRVVNTTLEVDAVTRIIEGCYMDRVDLMFAYSSDPRSDVIGRVVDTVTNTELNVGYFALEFDGNLHNDGSYLRERWIIPIIGSVKSRSPTSPTQAQF